MQSIFASLVAFGAASNALTPENWAVMERLSQWTAGWRMFAANPLVGVGIGNYNSVYADYRLPEWPVALGHAHNHYLTVAAEAGTFAAVAYVVLLVVAVRQTLRGWRTASTPFSRAIGLGALGSIGALAVAATGSRPDWWWVPVGRCFERGARRYDGRATYRVPPPPACASTAWRADTSRDAPADPERNPHDRHWTADT